MILCIRLPNPGAKVHTYRHGRGEAALALALACPCEHRCKVLARCQMPSEMREPRMPLLAGELVCGHQVATITSAHTGAHSTQSIAEDESVNNVQPIQHGHSVLWQTQIHMQDRGEDPDDPGNQLYQNYWRMRSVPCRRGAWS